MYSIRRFLILLPIFLLIIIAYEKSYSQTSIPFPLEPEHVIVCDNTALGQNGVSDVNCVQQFGKELYLYPYEYVKNTFTPTTNRPTPPQYYAEKFVFNKNMAGKIVRQEVGFYALPDHDPNEKICATPITGPISSIKDNDFPFDNPTQAGGRCGNPFKFMDSTLDPTYPNSYTAYDSSGKELERLPINRNNYIMLGGTPSYSEDFDGIQYKIPADGVVYIVNTFHLKPGFNDGWWYNYFLTFCHTTYAS